MAAPWSFAKRSERKAADAAVCAEASRWMHEVVADHDGEDETEVARPAGATDAA